jgi:murein DD-endopeptidase MepM/ murein hydrolase activator NlpD
VDPEGKVVARHRSPQGRRTHLQLPLPPVAAAAGAGVAGHVAAPAVLAPRIIAAVLAGGTLAAAGQTALSHTLPAATDGANMLKLSVQEFVGHAPVADLPAPAAPVAAPVVTLRAEVAPVAEPPVADVSELVKAAQLQARAAVAEAPAIASATPDSRPAPRVADVLADGVQMVAGRVSSTFGGRWGRSHNGIDIAAPIGTPIRAPLAGEVIASGPASGFGMWVRVRHDDGTVTTYGHVNRSLVRVGEQVTAGEEIAEVGNRGRSTGPHLHMEVQTPGGTTVNPRPWLDGHGIGY